MKVASLLALLLVSVAEAKLVTFEFPEGVAYVRPEALPGDLGALQPWVKPGKNLVLDLRGTQAEELAAMQLGEWYSGIHDEGHVRLVLLNDDTSPVLKRLFSDEVGDTVTLGPSGKPGTYDVGVATSIEADATAARALASGEDPLLWTRQKIAKERNDESSLARRGDLVAEPAPSGEKANATPHPIDLVLQRALQLAAAAQVKPAVK